MPSLASDSDASDSESLHPQAPEITAASGEETADVTRSWASWSRAELIQEIERLQAEITFLQAEKSDLELLNDNIIQHADNIEAQLHEQFNEVNALNHKLASTKAELERLARTDALTGLANRRFFDTNLEHAWVYLARDQKPLSLILGDIDFFKCYNDTYGHPAGDACLQQVAKLLQQGIRRPDDLVARYGGEELVSILPNTDADGAICVATNLHNQLNQAQIPHRASPIAPYVTMTFGIATLIPVIEQSCYDLVKYADQALYEAKSQGRNRFCLFNPH